ncbi:MAG: NAD(P)/FAD-dependent oxidoreductase, partial [Oscillospiraceae bacterium]|nr:NAD(P)/FAD-dependent oxidoreductase [Oscillospiraceae bacterium]
AVNFIPPFKGRELPGVCDLRSFADLNRLRRCAVAARDAVVIGGGVIGLEAAYVLAEHGLSVTVLEGAPYLMPRLLDRASAEYLQSRMTRFRVLTGVRVGGILGTDRAEAVEVEGMDPISAQVVLISCGVRANTALAQQAGLAVDRGVVVDEHMRTSAPDIYSCGNCAVYGGFSSGLWAEAVQQGRVAGINAAGGNEIYTGSDSSLLMYCSEFSLYSDGDLGMNKDLTYTQKERELRWTDGYRVNRAPSDLFERDFYVDEKLVGVFMLGDLRAMHQRRRSLFGADR